MNNTFETLPIGQHELKCPDPHGILLTELPPGTSFEEKAARLLSYMLRGPHWCLNETKPFGSRNALMAIIGGTLFQELCQIQERGWVAASERSSTHVMFHATDAGLFAMGVSRADRIRAIRTTRRYPRGKTIFPHPVNYYRTDYWDDTPPPKANS